MKFSNSQHNAQFVWWVQACVVLIYIHYSTPRVGRPVLVEDLYVYILITAVADRRYCDTIHQSWFGLQLVLMPAVISLDPLCTCVGFTSHTRCICMWYLHVTEFWQMCINRPYWNRCPTVTLAVNNGDIALPNKYCHCHKRPNSQLRCRFTNSIYNRLWTITDYLLYDNSTLRTSGVGQCALLFD